MTILFFCGPSLPRDVLQALLPEAHCLPPAECGDVYLASKQHPRAIAVVDGYFDHRLSVWHKELLWALSQGIAVYGASSMGALRAAELSTHGMVGVGKIYEWYRTGAIEDDDEVAVVHESIEYGYRTRCDPMVNIRATLSTARKAEVIDGAAEASVTAAAKAMFYPERTFVAAVANASGLSEPMRTNLGEWVKARGVIDQKRLDALALVERVKNDLANPGAERGARRRFRPTCYWDALRRSVDANATRQRTEDSALDTGKVDPLIHAEVLLHRAAGNALGLSIELELAATERALSLLLAAQSKHRVTAEEVQAASERMRRERGALTPDATSVWLAENGLDLIDFTALARDEVLVARCLKPARDAAARQVPVVLMLRGLYRRPPEDA